MIDFLTIHGVKSTAIAGIAVQVGRPIVSLVTLPLLLARLGQEGLGVWMIALSMMGLVGFVSGGLSANVITAIGRANGDSAGSSILEVTTSATLIAALWSGMVLTVLVPVAWLIDWDTLLRLSDSAEAEAVRELMTAIAVLLAFSLIAAIPRQIMMGRMHGYAAHLLDFSGAVAGAVGLIFALSLDAPLWILGMTFIAPSYVVVFLGGLVYLWHADIALYATRNLNPKTLRRLGRDSFRMVGYQGAHAVSSQSDLLLIGMILGTPASAAFGIAQRLFSLPVLVGATINYAQWPAMARADASGQKDAIVRMFLLTLVLGSGLAFGVSILMALVYQPLLGLWLGHELPTDPTILYGMVAWVLVATIVNTCDSVLRARNEALFLMRAMMAMAAINIMVTLFLLPKIGPSGAVWGSVAGYTLALLIPYALRLRTILDD